MKLLVFLVLSFILCSSSPSAPAPTTYDPSVEERTWFAEAYTCVEDALKHGDKKSRDNLKQNIRNSLAVSVNILDELFRRFSWFQHGQNVAADSSFLPHSIGQISQVTKLVFRSFLDRSAFERFINLNSKYVQLLMGDMAKMLDRRRHQEEWLLKMLHKKDGDDSTDLELDARPTDDQNQKKKDGDDLTDLELDARPTDDQNQTSDFVTTDVITHFFAANVQVIIFSVIVSISFLLMEIVMIVKCKKICQRQSAESAPVNEVPLVSLHNQDETTAETSADNTHDFINSTHRHAAVAAANRREPGDDLSDSHQQGSSGGREGEGQPSPGKVCTVTETTENKSSSDDPAAAAANCKDLGGDLDKHQQGSGAGREEKSVCSMCHIEPCETIFYPCYHKVCCLKCTEILWQTIFVCPFCKKNIISVC